MNLEVLSPVGDWERLCSAVDFGADAVYLGRKNFGMRANPQNSLGASFPCIDGIAIDIPFPCCQLRDI